MKLTFYSETTMNMWLDVECIMLMTPVIEFGL